MVLHPGGESAPRPAMKTHRKMRSKGTIGGYAFGAVDPGDASSDPPDRPSVAMSAQQQQSSGDASLSSNPCHLSRISLMCAQNALRMGARTQLNLCPPGRARRELQVQLRKYARFARRKAHGDSVGYFSLDRMLGPHTLQEYDSLDDEVLLRASAIDVESDEEASSGDEDVLKDINSFFSEESPDLDDDRAYADIMEPLFSSIGEDGGMNPNGAPSSMGASGGRLPFNRRKLRLFDCVSADDTAVARSYLRTELNRSRKRSGQLLAARLRKVQREELRRKRLERGERVDDLDVEDMVDTTSVPSGVSQFDEPMTPALAAALLIESMSLGRAESAEGMAKCYDGIVAAGNALIESMTVDPTTPASSESKTKQLRTKIMNALTPLLISSLEQPTGELILSLAKLRRLCGTRRYQRRLVQRVAPCLIRPPGGAMWCLRHQNDMEAILAASELIFDAAFETFADGWYEKGRTLLADSKRAETLHAAAMQLKSLGPHQGASLGLAGPRRRLKMKDNEAGESLAEWEVIAVDQQIRVSIGDMLSGDWSKNRIVPDSSRPIFRKNTSMSMATKRSTTIPQSAESSPKSIPSSPRSPSRPPARNQSPASTALPIAPTQDTLDSVLGPSFTTPMLRPSSPPPPPTDGASMSTKSPPQPNRDLSASVASVLPRSPRSPRKPEIDSSRVVDLKMNLSPQRTPVPKDSAGGTNSAPNTPHSPSSIGSSDLVSYKPALASAGLSPAETTPTSHYKTLTSTAAERKRTVAACRALRAQIQRFEDAFIQLHGRPPKGAVERAPLASTYAQYREWKRAIRADAACRIQALVRAASTRWALLRLDDPKVTRVVMRRAGRAGYSTPDLSIPAEIGRSDQPLRARTSSTGSAGSSEHSGSGSHQMLAPQWATKQLRPRTSSGDRLAGDSFSGVAYTPSTPSVSAEVGTLTELQARKRELKQQLKQYDMNFARQHGRMPVKAEKEPIRHLYESYNSLKSQISILEREARQIPMPTPSTVLPVVFQRTVSPSSGSDSGSGTDDAGTTRSSIPVARSKRKVPKSSSPPIATPSSSSAIPSDLVALRAEKGQLHQMLRSYERDFFRDNRRQVSSFSDIRPVASQYRRYKEIKKAIAALQEQK